MTDVSGASLLVSVQRRAVRTLTALPLDRSSNGVTFTLATERIVVLKRPMFYWGRLFDEGFKIRWDRPSFFYSFESVLPERALKPASGGLPKWGWPVSQKLLAVPVFIVQNGRAWS
jgi:hypothetical protein